MALRWRDLLLAWPAAVVVVGAIIEFQVDGPWAEFASFMMSPVSAASIVAYLLIERSGSQRQAQGADRA